MIWDDDPEKARERKLMKIGKNGAYAIGGGLACWGMQLFYPHPENADRIAAMFGPIGSLLLAYGVIILATLVFKKTLAPTVNFLFLGFVIPAGLFYIFLSHWPA